MNNTGVYKIINFLDNKCYIGSSVTFKIRKNEHLNDLFNNIHHSIKLQRAWNKYGEQNFKFEIIEECEKEKLIEREQYWINFYDSYKKGYNCCPIAQSSLGFKHSKESIDKMKKFQKGKKRSLKTKQRISKARKGVKHSIETCLKISNFRKTYVIPKSTIKKIIAKTSHPIIVILKSGKIKKYKSISSCSKQLKINTGDISRCVNDFIPHYKGNIFKLQTKK